MVPPHIHVIPGITPDQTFVVVVIVGNMAVPIVCPASARPGMMISFHAPLMQNNQYQSSLYQRFHDTGTTNTCNISNETRLEGRALNNSSGYSKGTSTESNYFLYY